MPESQLFSVGVDRLLHAIRPYGQAQTCYPTKLEDAKSRRTNDESLHQWFVRMVDEFCGGEPKLVALEENLAVFVRLGWKDKARLIYANIQTVWAECDLDEYYLDEQAWACYLRLDFDYNSLGDPFSHPLAHIHVEGKLSPRFALDGGNCGNIVVDYLEFLYRNYAPNKWMQWVRREWAKEFARISDEKTVNPLPRIEEAFATSQFQILRDYSNHLERIKNTLRKRKDSIFDCQMNGLDRVVLEYPSSR